MNTTEMNSELPIHDKGAITLKKAAADVVRERLRAGDPLILWEDGKIVRVHPQDLSKSQLDALEISEAEIARALRIRQALQNC